jgi:tRNA modification GTPase
VLTGDTIAAISSAPGRSARAIVRVSGPRALSVGAVRIEGAGDARLRRAARALVSLDRFALPALALVLPGPRSATGEDTLELVIPGNPALATRVLAAILETPGVRHAEAGEFTARGYLNGRLTLDQAEGVAASIAADTREQLRAAGELLSGATGDTYRDWGDRIATLLALVEAGIDFTDQEDVVAIAPSQLVTRLDDLGAEIDAMAGPSRAQESSGALPRVVLVGRPSAGKSTLFNALVGRARAITDAAPGTTRDALEEELDLSRDLPGAGAVALVDLPGLDDSSGGMLAGLSQRAARDAIARADAAILCDERARFDGLESPAGVPTVRVRTKADRAWDEPPAQEPGLIEVCALDGRGLAALRRAVAELACTSRAAGVAALLPRHREALARVRAALAAARDATDGGSRTLREPALVASHLRDALDAMGELAGRLGPDEILGRIFATFCVGK